MLNGILLMSRPGEKKSIDIVTTIIVNNKYFPMSGITNDVGGFISDNSRKNTVRASKIDMDMGYY
jgi:hypothetical protein